MATTPEGLIQDATDLISDLAAGGTLSQGEAKALTAKLSAALRKIEQAETKPAVNILGAFINQVHALVASDRLTAEQAQPLIDAANAAIELLAASV